MPHKSLNMVMETRSQRNIVASRVETIYNRLPAELRKLVWQMTFTPRIIILEQVQLYYRHGPQTTTCLKDIVIIPAALHTCCESRHIASLEYKILVIENPKRYTDRENHPGDHDYRIFFNCRLDDLYLDMAGPLPKFHFEGIKDDFYTCLRYLWLEVKGRAGPKDIWILLNEVRRFTRLQRLILEGCAQTTIQDNLERLEMTEWDTAQYCISPCDHPLAVEDQKMRMDGTYRNLQKSERIILRKI